MRNKKTAFSLFAGILIWGIATSCGAAAYYETIEQPSGESAVIKAGSEFKVKPIDFSAIKPADLGYANTEEWKADIEPVPQAFVEAFPILLKEANISNKKVTVIKKDEPVTNGIVVEVVVKSIVVKWNYFTAQPDELICNLTFTDVASGQKLFSGVVNVNSRSGNPYAQAYKASFSNRLQTAAYNIAWVLTKIMAQGKIDPAVY
ncbi:MAG: hypothetical protein A2031_05235 [Deltaproteobacteria bacterium RBG_19FT_COMBO_43_11]|nr:MAG: hypothetical protein A2W27_10425 [Deltaproteobacteria bacterium RBG_16_44_11]OGP87654.1 MAG: hypothetical protein A2031_05235 [Deltaproteobacteria bacterium RBG_19FT_COMBO_43_11]